jgi:hypothetical protein
LTLLLRDYDKAGADGCNCLRVRRGGCFAFVHRLDRHARTRIGSVLKSQGLVYHQLVTFVTDGGDTVLSWPKRLHPRAEHVIDWFPIAMRFTVLKQMAKGISIPDVNPDDPDDHPARLLERAKWFLWHGNVQRSLQRIDTLIELIEHDERVPEGPERRKLARALNELYDYLESNPRPHSRLWGSSSTRRSDFIVDRRIHRQSSDQPPVREETANAMATGNSAPAAPSAHPDAQWQAT